MASVEWEVTNKSLAEKCRALKDVDLENGLSNKDVAIKQEVQQKTILTWVKKKHNLTTSLEGVKSSQKIRVVKTSKK